MDVRVAGRRVPGIALTAPNYIGWLIISGLVAWAVLR
jgi:hypothetical protein